jgi:hypothetical protein
VKATGTGIKTIETKRRARIAEATAKIARARYEAGGTLLLCVLNPVTSITTGTVLMFRNGRRWFSTPERIAQWLDARAKRDPRLPAGVTSIDELMDEAAR